MPLLVTCWCLSRLMRYCFLGRWTCPLVYNALLRNGIEPKIEKILKTQNGFWRNRSTTSQILTIRRILEGVRAKNLEATILFVDFYKAFDSIEGRWSKYLLPKVTVVAIMMLYKNIKVKVCSQDGDTDYFDIVAGVLQGDTLAPHLFIIYLDYVFRTSIDRMKDNDFKLWKKDNLHKQLRTRTLPMT